MRENSNHEEMVECHYQGSIIYVPVRTFIEVTMKMRLERKRFVRYKEGAKHYSMSRSLLWQDGSCRYSKGGRVPAVVLGMTQSGDRG